MIARLAPNVRALLLDELDERAERRLRVHERDGRAPAARARSLVDHAVALGLHPLERGRAVVDAVPDVVEALTLLLQVLRDRRVVADRGEELDVGVGDLEQRLLDTVALDDLAVIDLAAERVAVVRDRGLEVVDRDRDVVDLGEQP